MTGKIRIQGALYFDSLDTEVWPPNIRNILRGDCAFELKIINHRSLVSETMNVQFALKKS